MDRENHIGVIVIFCLIFSVVIGLFVYTHFILGEHTHVADESEWVVETPSTCTENGYKYQVCKTCGISFNGTVTAPLNHDFAAPVMENVVNATCTTGGSYDMTSYCRRCNEIDTKESFTVPMLGHDAAPAVTENVVNATCTAEGSCNMVSYCNRCDGVVSEESVVIPMLEHKPAPAVKENEDPASCTKFGFYENVVYCVDCNTELTRELKIIVAPGHDYEEEVKNFVTATCTTDGVYDVFNHCKVCGYEEFKECIVISAIGHQAGETVTVEITLPNCTQTGYSENVTYCYVCNADYIHDGFVVPAEGHEHELVKFAINTTNGKPELSTKCDKCGETNTITEFSADELVHVITKPATCTATGTGMYVLNMVFEGCTISASCDVVEPIIPHYITAYDSYGNPYNIILTPWNHDEFGNEIYGYRYDTDFRKKYFDVSTPGLFVVVDESIGETYDSVWDEYGFAYAAYKCEGCGKWFIVDVYNAEYDSRKN